MTHATPSNTTFLSHDQFAKNLMAHIDSSTFNVSHNTIERLRFARECALGVQKTSLPQTTDALAWQLETQAYGSLALSGSNNGLGSAFNFELFGKWGSLLPLVALVVGLFLINHFQADIRTKELADIDSALLIDDLPPEAYADQGFGQFLKLQSGR